MSTPTFDSAQSSSSTTSPASPPESHAFRVRFPVTWDQFASDHALFSDEPYNLEVLKTVLNMAFELDFRTTEQAYYWMKDVLEAWEEMREHSFPPIKLNGMIHEAWMGPAAISRARLTGHVDEEKVEAVSEVLSDCIVASLAV